MKTAELLSLTKSLKTDTQEVYFRNREEKAFNSSWEDQELACRPESWTVNRNSLILDKGRNVFQTERVRVISRRKYI